MNYHVAIKGVKQGPLSEDEVRGMIGRYELQSNDLCWREGWDQWRALGAVFPESFPATGSPVSPVSVNVSGHDSESLRRAHLTHEASLQGIGSLYVFGSIILMFVGLMGLSGLSGKDLSQPEEIGNVVASVLFVLLSLVQGRVGLWLRKLNPKARTPATVLACIGLLGFPIGTLVNIYVLYLLRSKKGEVVFSPGYRAAIEATPHIKYKTPVIVWVLVGVLVLLVVGAIIAGISSR